MTFRTGGNDPDPLDVQPLEDPARYDDPPGCWCGGLLLLTAMLVGAAAASVLLLWFVR